MTIEYVNGDRHFCTGDAANRFLAATEQFTLATTMLKILMQVPAMMAAVKWAVEKGEGAPKKRGLFKRVFRKGGVRP